jgi:hypothetical protein
MFLANMSNTQLHTALECSFPPQAKGGYFNLRNYFEASLHVIFLYVQTETQITRSNFFLNQQYKQILSRPYIVYVKWKEKNSHFQNIYFVCQIFTREIIHNISFNLHKNSEK